MNPLSYVNISLALAIICLGAWYYLHGRPLDRVIMVFNVVAGLWTVVSISLIWVDHYRHDLFSDYLIRWIISVTLMVILGTKLMNMIRIGRRYAN